MGILNITPDSFSGDGLISAKQATSTNIVDAALKQARAFIEQGADIIDIGGESTRPGAQPVSLAEELERVIPVVKRMASSLDVLISIDTYKAEVANAALEAGADWINDIWGLRADAHMAAVVAQHQATVVLMHNRLTPQSAEVQARLGGRYLGTHYQNLIEDVKTELMESVALAHAAGIPDEKIILDPGLGFGKTVEQNLEIIARLAEFRSLHYPLLVGPSRKSFIGYTLNLPPDDRLEGTAAAVAISIANSADIVRVHDVAAMAKVARIADAITRHSPSVK